jgi:F0F1-type ATP synthase gamma subunit
MLKQLNKIKNLYARFFKKKNPPAKQMQFAFASGGKCFYQFSDEMLMPVERALSAQDVYTELDCKVDFEYLKMFCDAILELCDKGKLSQVAIHTELLKSRLTHITNIDLLYKLASIIYVEENEDPYSYDLAFAEKKIAFWKQNEDVDSFFLKKPIKVFIPFLDSSALSISQYYKAQNEEILRHLELLMNSLSEEVVRAGLMDTLRSHKERIRRSIALNV